MATDADPYRTLGLPRDATLDEVRRAYRRLAKANHPDAAGEAALPRFLAIQAAYDEIAGPDAGARRSGSARPTGPRRPWDADRDRTDATYRAYGGRARRARPTGPKPRPGAGASADRPPGTTRPPRPERPPNKATLGSTSYDGADAEPFEPDWRGASWYGTTSGTYWTLNPKEYADPRKHGPEYQARARRELDGRGEPDPPDASAPPGSETPSGAHATSPSGAAPESSDAEPAAGPADAPAPRTPPPPTHTTASWWETTAGVPPRPDMSATGRTRPPARPSRTADPIPGTFAGTSEGTAGPSSGIGADTLLEAVRTWLDDTHPGTVGRIARALIGWAPIALGIGWASGEMSGCGRFAAGCDDSVAASAWIVQLAALLVLIVVGRLARVTSVATLATLAAAIPAALLLSATGGPDDLAAGRIALSGLLVIAWVVGLAFGVVREVRRAAPGTGGGRSPTGDSDEARPVS
jgi:hypothetical protein